MTLSVTTAVDVVDASDGLLSLREAVQRANAAAGEDEIVFAPALEGQTIVLRRGQLTLADDVIIDGDNDDDGDKVTLDAGGRHRVVLVDATGTEVRLDDLVITGDRNAAPDPWIELAGLRALNAADLGL